MALSLKALVMEFFFSFLLSPLVLLRTGEALRELAAEAAADGAAVEPRREEGALEKGDLTPA